MLFACQWCPPFIASGPRFEERSETNSKTSVLGGGDMDLQGGLNDLVVGLSFGLRDLGRARELLRATVWRKCLKQ
jgi:hypothetical protein